mmetsp:Transcript_41205/g.118519  ORF Transcript_41205/g.118519 Transcript_41205/m.118519 type:complete len:262 (-) Transcript_41205:68-853(-)
MVAINKLVWWSMLCLWMPVAAQDGGGDDVATEPPIEWGGCEDPVNGKKFVTIGEKTTICLNIADGADWSEQRTYMRVHFQPIADEYSRFLVPNSFQELIEDTGSRVNNIFAGKNITVHAASQTAISFQKIYFDGYEKVFPFLTAIVDVKDGVVQGIAWDDASIFCGLRKKEPNTLDYAGVEGSEKRFGQPVDGCFFFKDDKECEKGCDLLLYVVWTGTDANGKSFMSSSYRYSAFPPQEWGDRFSNLVPDVELPEDLNPLD